MVARGVIRSLLLAAAMAAVTARARAQSGPRQSGSVTTSVGVGSGSATFTCPACFPQRQLSVAAKFRTGITVNPAWTIAMETSVWTKRFERTDGHSSAQLGFVDLVAQWYPAGGSEFFVSGGAGVALFHEAISDTGAPTATVNSASPAVAVGFGWDIPVAGRWGMTPYVDFLTGAASSANVDGTGGRQRFQPAVVQIGLGFTLLPARSDAAAEWGVPRANPSPRN
jgi:hypothetical protein